MRWLLPNTAGLTLFGLLLAAQPWQRQTVIACGTGWFEASSYGSPFVVVRVVEGSTVPRTIQNQPAGIAKLLCGAWAASMPLGYALALGQRRLRGRSRSETGFPVITRAEHAAALTSPQKSQ